MMAAAKGGAPDAPKPWLALQKQRLNIKDSILVLAALGAALAPVTVSDAGVPVRIGHRYLGHRREHLDDPGALAMGLPIGSGAIERAHRSVVQQRRKRLGAGRTPDNAEARLAVRITRANGQWSAYRQDVLEQAA